MLSSWVGLQVISQEMLCENFQKTSHQCSTSPGTKDALGKTKKSIIVLKLT